MEIEIEIHVFLGYVQLLEIEFQQKNILVVVWLVFTTKENLVLLTPMFPWQHSTAEV